VTATVRSVIPTPPWCPAETTLTGEEIAALDALPDGAHDLEASVRCEIQEGHKGPPMTLGQAYQQGGQHEEMWLLWDASDRELRVLPPCKVEDLESGQVCVLPLDHPGRCGFCLD
jgi:hypothetical protein